MTCPHCGNPPAAGGGPFCSHCGARLPTLHWVAEPPPSATSQEPPRPSVRYAGPPRYAAPPRWGFPALPWRPATPDVPARPGPEARVASLAATLVPLLWATAAVALVGAGAETWRYALLLASRAGALSARVVGASDALVGSAGVIAPTLALLAGILLVLWTLRAARAASDAAGTRFARSPRSIVLGWVVPGANLSVPGSVLAEIEHAALRRPAAQRPRPSRLLLTWWVLWAAGVMFGAVVLLWTLRDGVQARADGVVLHALLDLLAAATAAVTARLVSRLTRLIGPVRARPRELVVAIGGPPAVAPTAGPGDAEHGPDATRDPATEPVTPSPTAPAVRA